MTPSGLIKLESQLLDLPIVDSEGKYCGIVDDVELAGNTGGELTLEALLVGPGAYGPRLPGWAMWLATKLAGDHMVRVPMARVRSIVATVRLDCPGEELGLDKADRAAAKWLPRWGAM